MKYAGIILQTLQDEDMVFLLVNNFRCSISSVMRDRCVKSDVNKKTLYFDATKLYGHSNVTTVTIRRNQFWKNIYLKEIFNTPDDNEIGYF